MPYITMMQSPRYHQLSFEEIISGKFTGPLVISDNETNTRTYFTINVDRRMLDKVDVFGLVRILTDFCDGHSDLYKKKRTDLYNRFHIPKKSGGLREINAPVPELMSALRELKEIFETKFCALYHTSAFAYVRGRSTIDAVKKHQTNGSHWFLKTDFSDFFGSTTMDFLMRMLSQIFPFSEVVKIPSGKAALMRALDLCFLNGGLPQGTPISPMLTNLMMIPIDHRLYNCLRGYKGNNYVYTRYADDILISSRRNFDHEEIVSFIKDTLWEFHAPFSIKAEKTRYGSSAGSNWNLGLMLNKDNEITIGTKNKQRFRAMIFSYAMDRKNGKQWELHDVQVMNGLINYYSMVEKGYIDAAIRALDEKLKIDLEKMIKADLRR